MKNQIKIKNVPNLINTKITEMTAEEFNIKYTEYIEDRFDGLEFDIPEVTMFLDNIFEHVFTKVPGFQYAQIKLKFGMCRFYTNLGGSLMMLTVEGKIDNIIKSLENERNN